MHLESHGPPSAKHRILILHSNGMCAALYEGLAQELTRHDIATTAATLPGFDGTAPLPDIHWPALIEETEATIRTVSPTILLGHSLGGLLAVAVAPRVTLAGMVLMEPAIMPVRPLRTLAARIYARGAVETSHAFDNRGPGFIRLHDPDHWPQHARALRCRQTSSKEVERALVAGGPTLDPALEDLDMPVLIVRGASSGWLMRAGMYALGRRIPRAQHAVLADAGHWMVYEQDAALAGHIADFCAEHHAVSRSPRRA